MRSSRLIDQTIRIGLALVFVLGISLTAGIRTGHAAIDLGPQVRFEIVPQQLPSALLQFSEQSGVQVTSPGQLVEGKRSPGVVGTFSPGKALALLLKNTSLDFDVVDGKTVVITGGARQKSSRNELRRVSEPRGADTSVPGGGGLMLAEASPATTAVDLTQNQGAANSLNTAVGQTQLEEVIVTGSSIKRINAETALPVTIMKREDIERTGATTAEELLHKFTAVSSIGSTVVAQETGTQTGAISTISLRGLGSARTLVLINGKRSAVYGGGPFGASGSSVDISSIPVAAIERVEVLKDGASAVYGSDAIAGVVNFIMRSNFQGLEATATGGTPTEHGGGQQEIASLYAGHGDIVQNGYNAALGFNFEHDNPILGASRPFALRYSPGYGNDVTSGFAFPANVAIPKVGTRAASTRNPLVPNCAPSLADTNFPTQCRFDNSPYDSVQPEQKKFNVSFHGQLAVNNDNQLYTEDSFSRVRTLTSVQPVPLSYQNPLLPGDPYIPFLANLLATQYPNYHNPAVTPGTGAFLLPPSSPYYPTAFATQNGINGQPLNLIYRDFANGTRLTEDTADTLRFVAGFKGESAGWDYDTWLLYNEVKVKEDLLAGYALYSKMMPLLDSGVINPFGPTNDPAALAQAQADTFIGEDFHSKTSASSLSGRASRQLYALPYGPLSAAVGAEFRRETFEYDPAAAIQTGDIAGQGGNTYPESASRNVVSTFLEFNAVLAKGLEIDVAGRYDHYQAVGNTGNPKASLRWQPEQWILLRAAAGTGFRAPSLTDLYAPQATSVTSNGTRDPIKCPTFDANNSACSFQFSTITGGNPRLTPEKSQSYTLGLVFEPTRDFSVGLDSFWIYLRNQIVGGGLNYAYILQNVQTATQYASLINRNAAGQIVSISQTNANLFKTTVGGLDIDLKYGFDMGGAGRLTFVGNGTYFLRYVAQNADGSWTSQLDKGLPPITTAGGVISRWRDTVSAIYDTGPWELSVTDNYQKRYRDTLSSVTQVFRYVSAYETVDAQLLYRGLKSFQFTLGAKNLFNRIPPYTNYGGTANNFIGGYDISYGDPRGRFVYLTARYTLH
jgi:iron complex outermembrane receptor protein